VWNIAGSGIAGSYLYGRMRREGYEVRIFDPKVKDFYIPCGFATNKNLLRPYLNNLNIEMDQVLEVENVNVEVAGNNFNPIQAENIGLCTINKMKMEQLMGGGEVLQSACPSNPDQPIIDATGISRFYLPASRNDKKMFAIEKVSGKSEYKGFYFYFFPEGRGYFWSFPLRDRYHIGAGGIDLDEVKSHIEKYEAIRTVSRRIRMRPINENITSGNVLGVGESIGYISPLLGEGIIPALESAEALFQSIKKSDDIKEISIIYRDRISKRMKEFEKIANLVENVQSGKIITPSNIFSLKLALNEVKKFGFSLSLRKILAHFL
jgi:hypothetical protein